MKHDESPPVKLGEMADQPQAVALLQRALRTRRVAHAYAFVGPAGSGRTTVAIALARALLCEQATDSGDACGACRDCALVAGRQHPDVHLIVPTPPETNPKGPRAIRIAAIRELERQAALRPARGRAKVFVLDDAERMTGDAPQAFLKILEEPPPGTVFVLVLPGLRAVPATVLSRCQIVRFRARPDPRVETDRREALELLEVARAQGADALFRRTSTLDRDRVEGLVDAYWGLCRDLLLARAGVPVGLLLNGERAAELARVPWTTEGILETIEACRRGREGLVNNVTPRLTLEVIVSRLVRHAA
jgi:DNA polymerase III gamma/tau subunit